MFFLEHQRGLSNQVASHTPMVVGLVPVYDNMWVALKVCTDMTLVELLRGT